MYKENIILGIVDWIEANLSSDNSLAIDVISERSGYSKWHLQRMFKSVTGYQIAKYIRYRRLSCAALELCNTDIAIINISQKYSFDSQQSFTRIFKKRYKRPPGDYRKNNVFDESFIFPKWNKK
jgi:AraC family transcriptional activator of mar-sox-rob regulon